MTSAPISRQRTTNIAAAYQPVKSIPLRDLQKAILSPHDRGQVEAKVRIMLGAFYSPETDAHSKAALISAFADTLAEFPTWAVMRGCDEWLRQHSRRPTPAEIRILAKREIERIAREIQRRTPSEPEPQRPRLSDEKRAAIMREYGGAAVYPAIKRMEASQ